MKDSEVRFGAREQDEVFCMTASGARINLMAPEPSMFNADDIARHTGNLCRFTGATSMFYSVAQHQVLVAQLIKGELDKRGEDKWSADYWNQIIAGLLHDAAEAYVNDLSSPLKRAIKGKYKWIESGIARCIFKRFNCDWDFMNAEVKTADNVALAVERNQLLPDHPDWPSVGNHHPAVKAVGELPFMDPKEAADAWMNTLRSCIMMRNKYEREFGDVV